MYFTSVTYNIKEYLSNTKSRVLSTILIRAHQIISNSLRLPFSHISYQPTFASHLTTFTSNLASTNNPSKIKMNPPSPQNPTPTALIPYPPSTHNQLHSLHLQSHLTSPHHNSHPSHPLYKPTPSPSPTTHPQPTLPHPLPQQPSKTAKYLPQHRLPTPNLKSSYTFHANHNHNHNQQQPSL